MEIKIGGRKINQLEIAFHTYLATYFEQRNFDATIKLLHPQNTGFGTALDERGDSFELSKDLYHRDIQQAPEPIAYTIQYLDAQYITQEFGIVRAELDIRTTILNHEVKLNNLRISMVFSKNHQNKWFIVHHHTSLPSKDHGDTESYPVKELEDRAAVLERLVDERTQELHQLNQQLTKLAITDSLTGLYNRIKADEFLAQELTRLRRYGSLLSIILFDVDHFKHINDTHGHGIGDEVLKKVGGILQSMLRSTDLAARWGGDEFLIICPQVNQEKTIELAERIRNALETMKLSKNLTITASLGITEVIAGDSPESIIDRADQALYDAKHKGRNRIEKR